MEIKDFEKAKNEFYKVKHNPDEWAEWSLHPHTGEEIIFREILSEMDNEEYVSPSYYCRYSKLTEKDIDALLYVNSGLFSYYGWDDETQEFVINLLLKGGNVFEEVSNAIEEGKLNRAFLEVCKDMRYKAALSKVGVIRNRRDDVSRMLSQILNGYLKMVEDMCKGGKSTASYLKEIDYQNNQIDNAIEKLREDMKKFLEFRITLKDTLDWASLLECQDLSPEYIESRRPLWEYTLKSHRKGDIA